MAGKSGRMGRLPTPLSTLITISPPHTPSPPPPPTPPPLLPPPTTTTLPTPPPLPQQHQQHQQQPIPYHSATNGCVICHRDDDHANLLICERCNAEYHTYCLSPPLRAVPDGDFFCDACLIHRRDDDDEAASRNNQHLAGGGAVDPSSSLPSSSSSSFIDRDSLLERGVAALPPRFTSRFGSICWANGGHGFGWWPACIYDPRLTVGSARQLAMKNLGKKHLVYFFECHEAPFTVLGEGKLMTWEEGWRVEGVREGKVAKGWGGRRGGCFEKALMVASVEVEKPMERRMEWNHQRNSNTGGSGGSGGGGTASSKKKKKKSSKESTTTVVPPPNNNPPSSSTTPSSPPQQQQQQQQRTGHRRSLRNRDGLSVNVTNDVQSLEEAKALATALEMSAAEARARCSRSTATAVEETTTPQRQQDQQRRRRRREERQQHASSSSPRETTRRRYRSPHAAQRENFEKLMRDLCRDDNNTPHHRRHNNRVTTIETHDDDDVVDQNDDATSSQKTLYCQILVRRNNVGFVTLERSTATFAEARRAIDDELTVGMLPKRYKFMIRGLGPVSERQETKFRLDEFYGGGKRGSKGDEGTLARPLELVLMDCERMYPERERVVMCRDVGVQTMMEGLMTRDEEMAKMEKEMGDNTKDRETGVTSLSRTKEDNKDVTAVATKDQISVVLPSSSQDNKTSIQTMTTTDTKKQQDDLNGMEIDSTTPTNTNMNNTNKDEQQQQPNTKKETTDAFNLVNNA